MNKFENGKIYKIVDNLSDMVYVGSTYKTLQQRLKAHEINFKAYKAGKQKFITSYKILKNADYKIELIENYPCNTKQELNLREGCIIKHFRNNKLNIVNICIAGQTQKESIAQHYQKNKEIISEKAKPKYNCSCGSICRKADKSRHEKTKKHQNYINNSKTINIQTLNLNITVNKIEDLDKILKTINK